MTNFSDCSEWNAGALTSSSWHGLEEVRSMETADDMIAAGNDLLAWPTSTKLEDAVTASGLKLPLQAVVSGYADGSKKCHGVASEKWTPLDRKMWDSTIRAAVDAGAKPAGAFSLRGGARVLATFEITRDDGTGLRRYFQMLDSLDRSCAYIVGGTTIRTVCANTVSMSLRRDGKGMSKVRHTRSINDRAELVRQQIEAHIKEGHKVADLYKAACDTYLSTERYEEIMEALVPTEGTKGRTLSSRLRQRDAMDVAMARPENREGDSVASLWNAATWLVDRKADGETREIRKGSDALDSMLLGARGRRVQQVQDIMVAILRPDGSEEYVTAQQAGAEGIDDGQIGRAMIDQML